MEIDYYGITLFIGLVVLPILSPILKVILKKHTYRRRIKGSNTGRLDITTDNTMSAVDALDGFEFEYWCSGLLVDNGYTDVSITSGSGDQGVDIIAFKSGLKYAIQCKRYSNYVNNKSVQEVFTGKEIYHCDVAAVMTNSFFTRSAIEAAKATGVLLWDRRVLIRLHKNRGKESLAHKVKAGKWFKTG